VDHTFDLLCSTTHDVNVRGLVWPSFSLASAIITALLAPSRGRSAFGWFFIGGIVPWISLVILYVIRDLNPAMQPPVRAALPNPLPNPGPPDAARWASISEPAVALPQDGWFYALRRQAMGPVSLPYLRGAIEMGTLSRDVPVWCSAFRDWATPARIPGFFG
jgi:hypothetical protein